jgi:hypothetical protein
VLSFREICLIMHLELKRRTTAAPKADTINPNTNKNTIPQMVSRHSSVYHPSEPRSSTRAKNLIPRDRRVRITQRSPDGVPDPPIVLRSNVAEIGLSPAINIRKSLICRLSRGAAPASCPSQSHPGHAESIGWRGRRLSAAAEPGCAFG